MNKDKFLLTRCSIYLIFCKLGVQLANIDIVVKMAVFMHVRGRKTYHERRQIGKCKQLLRFDDVNVDFLASEFLPDQEETRGGALSSRQKMEILLRYLADPGTFINIINVLYFL